MTDTAAFYALHHAATPLLVPNCWDAASARVFNAAGFPALATSSAGMAWSLGYPDGNAVDTDELLAALGRILRVIDVPLTADIESGYATDLEGLRAFVARLSALGVSGCNLEDGRTPTDLYPIDEACARIAAVKDAAPALFCNARTDILLHGIGPVDGRVAATIERIKAFADAGADGIFVPGATDDATIRALVAATPLPLNILAGPDSPHADELGEIGVRRISVGSRPILRTLGELTKIAAELRRGTFEFARNSVLSYADANALFTDLGTPARP